MKNKLIKITTLLFSIGFFLISCNRNSGNDNQSETSTAGGTSSGTVSTSANESIEESPIEINVKNIDISSLPNNLNYKGKITNSVRWKDKMGDNIVITTESGIYKSSVKIDGMDEEVGDNAEVSAYHFLIQNESPIQLWKMNDYEKDCMFDVEANFVENAFEVTDLNNNGIAETWLMYITACRSDVSPENMKIIMYEGQQKYAMRGNTKVRTSENEYIGGDFIFDEAFLNSPEIFRTHAKTKWKNQLQ